MDDRCRVLVCSDTEVLQPYLETDQAPPAFEMAGPRAQIFFEPATLTCGIVTCGGLCPGLNNVMRKKMTRRRRVFVLATGLLGLVLAAAPLAAWAEPDTPRVVNLYAAGPQPQRLEVRAGDAVVWVSHLALTKLVVVTLAFLDGARVAEATAPVAGYNGFALEGEHFVGRMEGSGGKVALRFATSGAYTYALGHEPDITGIIVVAK